MCLLQLNHRSPQIASQLQQDLFRAGFSAYWNAKSAKKSRLSVRCFELLLKVFGQFAPSGVFAYFFENDLKSYSVSEDTAFHILESILRSTQASRTCRGLCTVIDRTVVCWWLEVR